MKITVKAEEYYNSPDEVMHLVQYLGEFKLSESEEWLTLEFEEDPMALAKCHSTGYSYWAERLVLDYLKSKRKDPASPTAQQMSAAHGNTYPATYNISVPKSCRCSDKAIKPE